jgi:hypothetical protein
MPNTWGWILSEREAATASTDKAVPVEMLSLPNDCSKV